MSTTESYWIYPKRAYKCTNDFNCDDFLCHAALFFWVEGCAYWDEDNKNMSCGCCGPEDRICIDCYICLTPFGFAFDMVTLPFRILYCIGDGSVQTCIKVKNCCCKVVDKQPTAG